MSIQSAAQEIADAIQETGDELEVNFGPNGITIYWHTLRLEPDPRDLGKALSVIKQTKALGARFE